MITQPDEVGGDPAQPENVAGSLGELEQRRGRLYAELAATGDFRRGSLTENYRRCGKANCACGQPDHPGHGPRVLWTRSVAGKTQGRQLRPGPELDKTRGEIANYQRFVALSQQIVEINEAICDARPVGPPGGEPTNTTAPTRAEKGGSRSRSPPR